MNKINNKFFVTLIVAFCLPVLLSGQVLRDRINTCYKHLIKNQDITLNIDVRAWKKGKKDRPIDQTNFIYTKDKKGFYMKTLDIEVIQNRDLTLRLDHDLKQVYLIPSPKQMEPDDMGLPTWLRHMDNLDSLYTIEVDEKKEGEVYTLKKGNYEEMLITINGKRITKLIQYPPHQVVYKGKSIATVVEMNYSYSDAQPRLQLSDVINQSARGMQLKSKYSNYKVIDYRDPEADVKK